MGWNKLGLGSSVVRAVGIVARFDSCLRPKFITEFGIPHNILDALPIFDGMHSDGYIGYLLFTIILSSEGIGQYTLASF